MTDAELEMQYRDSFEKLSNGSWEKMDLNERVETLNKIEQFAAMMDKRPPAKFEIDSKMEKSRNGIYDTNQNIIVQNAESVQGNNPDKSIRDLLHEGRYAYQYDCITHPERHREVSDDQIKEWKNNFENYIVAGKNGDRRSYHNQPVERDARRFSKENYKSYLNGKVFENELKKLRSKENDKMSNESNKKESLIDKFRARLNHSKENNLQQNNDNVKSNSNEEHKQIIIPETKTKMQHLSQEKNEFLNSIIVTPEQLQKGKERQEKERFLNSKKDNSNNNDDGKDGREYSDTRQFNTNKSKSIEKEI